MSVLFYHRVADTCPNPWSIGTAEFASQIHGCKDRFDLISLEELQRRSRAGASFRPSLSVTFDDGYAENCGFAIPLLLRLRIPCTYFVTLGNVLTGAPFRHDTDRQCPLPINTIEELRAMADAGIEIGLHTRNHFDFSSSARSGPVDAGRLRCEIIDAASELAHWIGRPVRYFAFPYGMPEQLTPAAIQATIDAGMIGFCSAFGGYNFPGQDAFHIRRFHGDPDTGRFLNWISFDAKKVKREPAIVSPAPPAPPVTTESPTALGRAGELGAAGEPGQLAARRPLRALFVITSMPVGGAETLLVNLIDQFDPKRIIPEVVCLKEPGPLGEQISSRHRLHHGLIGGKFDLSVLPRLTRLFRERAADAVITVGAGDKMFWGRLAAKVARVPVIASALHSTGWPDGIGRLNRLLTPCTDAFIAVAEHHGDHLVRREGFPPRKVAVIRNGIDCERFKPDANAASEIRAELGLPPESRLVGIVAALRPEKNHRLFVDVASQIAQGPNGPQTHFLIVGDGPERSTIEGLIADAGLQRQVHLLGTRHDTPRIVAALDTFLLCSQNEASPVSILEALAAEVPVVATDVGSVAESVREGETGFLVACDDRETMARRVKSLLCDEALRRRMGIRGRQWVMQTGSLEQMVDGYTKLIERLYTAKWCGLDFPAPVAVSPPLSVSAPVSCSRDPSIAQSPDRSSPTSTMVSPAAISSWPDTSSLSTTVPGK